MATVGTATLDFGVIASPTSESSIVVTGQAGILTGSKVEAWVKVIATADHTSDEIDMEEFRVWVDESTIVAGTGFTIFGRPRSGRVYGAVDVNWVWS